MADAGRDAPGHGALKVTLPVDNSGGKIVHLKAFVVDFLLFAVSVGSAVSFGDI